VSWVSGGAIFPLRAGESAIVSEEDVQDIASDWLGDQVYRALWGSRIFTYDLTITVAPSLTVNRANCASVAGPQPELNIWNDRDGTHIQVVAPRPWLATISVIDPR
jgi:hypothetical protein